MRDPVQIGWRRSHVEGQLLALLVADSSQLLEIHVVEGAESRILFDGLSVETATGKGRERGPFGSQLGRENRGKSVPASVSPRALRRWMRNKAPWSWASGPNPRTPMLRFTRFQVNGMNW